MSERTDPGDDERPIDGRTDPRVQPPFGPPFGSPYGSPFPPPFGPPFGSPYGAPFPPPFRSPYGAPFSPPFGSPFGSPYGAPFSPPFYPPFGAGFPPLGTPTDMAWYRPFLEAQRSYLLWYREQLERCSGDQSIDEQLREAMTALMASWLETMRAFREQREQALRAQSEMVSRYLDVLDQLLQGTDDR